MKKAASIFLTVSILFCLCFSLTGTAAALPGDVDGDGAVTAGDARFILRFSVNLEAPLSAQRAPADIDDDGEITASDARYALRMAVGLDTYFNIVLYNTAHPYVGATFKDLPPKTSMFDVVYQTAKKWCCYYTIRAVFRPALEKAGYSKEEIDRLAPDNYDAERKAKAIKTMLNSTLPKWMLNTFNTCYFPSLLLDYYLNHPEVCTCYTFRPYYDDMIEDAVLYPSENIADYQPRVGDILFASNKVSTYVNDLPTVDHTAQIISVDPDDTFTCTDGCILQPNPNDEPYVTERHYIWWEKTNTYIWEHNDIVQTLVIVRPNLYESDYNP